MVVIIVLVLRPPDIEIVRPSRQLRTVQRVPTTRTGGRQSACGSNVAR